MITIDAIKTVDVSMSDTAYILTALVQEKGVGVCSSMKDAFFETFGRWLENHLEVEWLGMGVIEDIFTALVTSAVDPAEGMVLLQGRIAFEKVEQGATEEAINFLLLRVSTTLEASYEQKKYYHHSDEYLTISAE